VPVRTLFRHGAVGDREQPVALPAERLEGRLAACAGAAIERPHLAAGLVRGRDREDALGRALGHEQPLASALGDHAHAPPLEVERQLVELAKAVDIRVLVAQHRRVERAHRGPAEHGLVDRVVHAALEVAVDVGEEKRPLRGLAERVGVGRELHLAGGERPRLVAAEHVDAAEVLDGREARDDHLLARQPHRALRERDGGDHRQELGREPHGQGHREEQRLQRFAPERGGDHGDEEHEEEHEPENESPELGHAPFELGLRRAGREGAGDVAEGGVGSGREHDRCRGAAHHRRAEEHRMGHLDRALRRRGSRVGVLFGGQRLAGERGLVHVQIFALDQARIGRDQVARGEPEDVARHQLAPRDLAEHPVSQRGRGGRDLGAKPLDRAVRSPRLRRLDRDAQRHDDHDDRRIRQIAEGRRRQAGEQEDAHERVREAAQYLDDGRLPLRGRRLVGPEAPEPLPRLLARQPAP
jgi:hypothetical protein